MSAAEAGAVVRVLAPSVGPADEWTGRVYQVARVDGDEYALLLLHDDQPLPVEHLDPGVYDVWINMCRTEVLS